MNRWIVLLLIMLLAGCSTSSEPEPEPPPAIQVSINAPDDMYKDDLQPVNVGFAHPDGLTGVYRHTIGTEELVEKVFSGEASWDTTYTPQLPVSAQDLDETTISSIIYDLESDSSTPVRAGGSQTLRFLESPDYEGILDVLNVLSKEGIDGYVTLQESGVSLPISDGQARIDRSLGIQKSDLNAGIEALVEAPGYVNHNETVRRSGDSLNRLQVIPKNSDGMDFDTYLSFLRKDAEGNSIVHQFEKGSTIDVYVVDQGVFAGVDGVLQRIDTQNTNLYATDEFIDHSQRFIEFVAPILKEVGNIDMNVVVQSETDMDFPLRFPENSFTVGSYQNGLFDVVQFSELEGNVLTSSAMLQQVFAETGSGDRTGWIGPCVDGFQSFIYSVDNPRPLCEGDSFTHPSTLPNGGFTELADPVMRVNYHFSAGDGFYRNVDLVGKDAQQIDTAWHVRGQ